MAAKAPSNRRILQRTAVSLLVVLIRAYQGLLRPFLAGHCKFCPTCSEYAVEALHTHGIRRGVWLAARRVVRCHPFSSGGIDPVPRSQGQEEDSDGDSTQTVPPRSR